MEQDPTPSGAERTSVRIAVVDDEPAIVDIAAVSLESAGFDVLRASSAEDCLAQLVSTPVDAVLTDICMGGMDGFALIEALSETHPSTKVVVMTAYDSYEMVRTALASGAYDYIDKPLDDYEAIASTMSRAAEAGRLMQRNAALLERLARSNSELETANERLLELNRRLRLLAHTDGLTRLFNRRYIDHVLTKEVERRNRYPDPLAIALIDVDHFKDFNDRYGHEGGDRALQAVARELRSAARKTDVVARYGGEEFIIVLPKTTPAAAATLADRLRDVIGASAMTRDVAVGSLTVSIGIAGVVASDAVTDVTSLTRAADRALYAAKAAGRNRTEVGRVEPTDPAGGSVADAA